MEIPQVVERFIETQHSLDSNAFAECFTDNAIVHDEGKTHNGKQEIEQWIKQAMENYESQLEPLNYEQSGANSVLTANVSGTFPGSPIVLKFHFGIKDNLIESLSVTE
ncbi:nuclear transport factor 2 family protein [Mucilaginibacter pallidiroseus]|uniref:Nuclear transport factor 2 family protein n=1 Tax=Mucilaginibacter pallidiroseus TaxID=2599295 RepID=A0A563TZL9_9SPHI|nr:nuclear transport factor 2 family protein [Mucilaginibacter pallidiroseus]TWR24723.1 nuclear transport factor 2 family protein [Mucilaginibacter pallidiroseus]